MRLELEVQFEPQPIRGWIHDCEDEDRRSRAFTGWLGLISAIEAARPREPDLRPAPNETAG